ncbi:MAG: glycerophosphodiester phosphodiesterase [Streptosporangiales bacterium]|nr:glycerophosphodiester phosphodiesterase [Streptosporangiales bacterium]
MGLRPENTLASFAHALELGVDALELDVGLSSDGEAVITHDPVISATTTRDTAAAFTGDPLFPYVGRRLVDLTLGQLRMLDVGGRRRADPEADPFVGTQVPVPGSRMPTLAEVIALLRTYRADRVRLTVELKSVASAGGISAGPRELTERVVTVLADEGFLNRVSLQSFDWRVLRHARDLIPAVPRNALVEPKTLVPGSPWLDGLDLADFGGDVAAAAAKAGADALAARRDLVDEPLMRAAWDRGLPVIAWTVNEPAEMSRLIDLGVSALITDYPNRLRAVMLDHGMRLPRAYAATVPV